jgi:hypothetical protein
MDDEGATTSDARPIASPTSGIHGKACRMHSSDERPAYPVLSPAQTALAHIPLGPSPWLHRLRSGSLRIVRRLHSYYDWVRLLVPVHHRLRLLAFPMRTRSAHGLWSDTRYPSFRRDPFARDVALDPGGPTMPRITALPMLRSTMKTVSAPAIRSFRGSLPHPTQTLCTLRVRRHRRLTQHSLPGGLLDLTWAGLTPADRASFCWRLPSFNRSKRNVSTATTSPSLMATKLCG